MASDLLAPLRPFAAHGRFAEVEFATADDQLLDISARLTPGYPGRERELEPGKPVPTATARGPPA